MPLSQSGGDAVMNGELYFIGIFRLAFDGVHFTEEGQTFFARKLAEALLEESYDRLHFS